MWLLTDEEQCALLQGAIARHQLQKIALSLYAPCTEHHDDGTYMIDCERCLDGLTKEAGL